MRSYIPDELVEEEIKLMELFRGIEEISIDELVEKYASEKFKDYFKKEDKRCKDAYEKGIIIN